MLSTRPHRWFAPLLLSVLSLGCAEGIQDAYDSVVHGEGGDAGAGAIPDGSTAPMTAGGSGGAAAAMVDGGAAQADAMAQGQLCTDASSNCGFDYVVSNVAVGAQPLTAEVVLDCGTIMFDTDALTPTEWCGVAVEPVASPQLDGGQEVALINLASLTVAADSTLKFVGSRPVVLLVAGDVLIDGTLDVSADMARPGPGGDNPMEASDDCMAGTGADGGEDTTGNDGGGGGGGAGFGQPGAAGSAGNCTTEGDGGAAGAVDGAEALVPLSGGCAGGRGGRGWTATEQPRSGGAGGGAIQISAAGALRVGASGIIDAGGGGGSGSAGGEDGGSGGGSGGAVLLEAATIETEGLVLANGGGGGEGVDTASSSGPSAAGQDGALGDTAALGGSSGAEERGADGGNGGLSSGGAASPGQENYSDCGDGGGGGGGGAGRVVTRPAG